MWGLGEIVELIYIVNLIIGLIINVGIVYIGCLGFVEVIVEVKCELLREMFNNSIVILNYDDKRLIEIAVKFWFGIIFIYGLEGGDLQGNLIDFKIINVDGRDLFLFLFGSYNVFNYLVVLVVLKVLDGKDIFIKILFEFLINNFLVQLLGSRVKRYDLENDIVILDESYNVGLELMIVVLNLLVEILGKCYIVVLGIMKELGDKLVLFYE